MAAAEGATIITDAVVEITVGEGPAVAFSNQLDEAILTPEQDVQTRQMLDPTGTLAAAAKPTWTVTLSGVQDYVAARGLARLLTDNNTKRINLHIEPIRDGVGVDVTVIAKATPFGGKAGEWAELSVELPVVGQPEFIDPVGP